MFKVRNLIHDDYDELLVKWWTQWRWQVIPRDFLPQNGTGGIMIEIDGVPIVAGFLYLTNSAVAWTEFTVSNFEFKDKIKRKEAIKLLIIEICRIAKECNVKYMYTSVKNENLKNTYTELGFSIGSKNATEMVMAI